MWRKGVYIAEISQFYILGGDESALKGTLPRTELKFERDENKRTVFREDYLREFDYCDMNTVTASAARFHRLQLHLIQLLHLITV